MRSLTLLLSLVSDKMLTQLLVRLFNHALKGQYLQDQLLDIDNKRILISIPDSGSELMFVIRDRRFCYEPYGGTAKHWDVKIGGGLHDFWRLASRVEDPDTLFFNRRLTLEGETEIALYIKNMLDGFDFDPQSHLVAVLGESLGRRVFTLLQRTGIDQGLRQRLGLPQL